MLFNSIEFILFFIVFITIYYLIPTKGKRVLLLMWSYLFYMVWNIPFVLLLIGVTWWNYLRWKFLTSHRTSTTLRMWLIGNIVLLLFFKYYWFWHETLTHLWASLWFTNPLPYLHILLPLWISFFTFQAIGYLVDVYNQKIPAEKNFITFALFLSFFPQLIAWPIERAKHLLPQFDKTHQLDRNNIGSGMQLIIRWLFKKAVIADRLAFFVDHIYSSPAEFSTWALWIGTIFFAFQIYCDFSWYSDIAIGCAKMLWYDLMKNFKKPYLATNIADFWRDRHISLSTWFKDYIYIPMGWNRVTTWKRAVNILVTFLISWLRHGAAWTYIIWWWLHGILLVFYRWSTTLRAKFFWKSSFSTFLALSITFFSVCLTWVFFRAWSLDQALYIIQWLFWETGWVGTLLEGGRRTYWSLLLAFGLIIILMIVEYLDHHHDIKSTIQQTNRLARTWTGILILTIILLWIFDNQQFIYFQF